MTDDDRNRCGAKTASGEPCKKYPVTGGTRCVKHGGSSPQAIAAAKKRTVAARLHAEVARRGYEPVTNPALLLARVAGEAEAFKDAAKDRMDRLSSWESINNFGTEAVAPIVTVYAAALRDVAQVAERLWKLGLDHKALAMEAERPSHEQAQVLSRIIDAAVAAADLSDDQMTRFRTGLATALQTEGLIQ